MNKNEMPNGFVEIDGTRYETSLDKKFLNRKKYQAPNLNLIETQIPGTVHEICVQVGEKVSAGQKIAVFIAMKMHNIILAPKAGVVKSVNVALGDRVPKGHVLFEIE
jgi:biotin carboxyl carrier protein